MPERDLPRDVWIDADRLITLTLRHASGDPESLERAVRSSLPELPLDFPVRFTSRLPFRLDRAGMIGVTIFGRVWLRDDLRQRPAIAILSTIVHEAVHVAQQRASPLLFYPAYFGGWGLNLLRPGSGHYLRSMRSSRGRRGAAYRSIPAEREAYVVEARFRARLLRRLGQEGIAADLF